MSAGESGIPYRDIPDSARWEMLTEVTYGYSPDKKFIVTAKDGEKYFLRITVDAGRSQDMLSITQKVCVMGISTPATVAHGYCGDGKYYILQQFIRGRLLEEILPALPEEEQYTMGIEAGRLLKRLHTIRAPEQEDWR